MRRVNLLVALASRSPDQSVRGELVRQGRELVLRNVPLTLEETRAVVDGWRELPVEDIRRLRHLKNLLRPLATLPVPLAQSHGTLQPWIELLPSLP